jgi:hypothetical protein
MRPARSDIASSALFTAALTFLALLCCAPEALAVSAPEFAFPAGQSAAFKAFFMEPIAEGTIRVGDTLGTIAARRTDGLDELIHPLHFYLVPTSPFFEINELTGVIISTKIDGFDYESLPRDYIVNIQVRNQGSGLGEYADASAFFTVSDMNDEIPVFEQAQYVVSDHSEDEAVGALIAVVAASDADGQFVNRNFGFYLGDATRCESGVDVGDVNVLFSISSPSEGGEVRLTRRMDYEKCQQYVISIRVTDTGSPPLSSTATITFDVTDVNDNAPIFQVPSHWLQGFPLQNIAETGPGGYLRYLSSEERLARMDSSGDLRPITPSNPLFVGCDTFPYCS